MLTPVASPVATLLLTFCTVCTLVLLPVGVSGSFFRVRRDFWPATANLGDDLFACVAVGLSRIVLLTAGAGTAAASAAAAAAAAAAVAAPVIVFD